VRGKKLGPQRDFANSLSERNFVANKGKSKRRTAREAAATEAVRLGYTRVYVMPEGIFGWINAGKPVEKSKAQK